MLLLQFVILKTLDIDKILICVIILIHIMEGIMFELLEDIKKSPEYLETNTKLNKLRKQLDYTIESYDNGAISDDKFTKTLWNLHSDLSIIHSKHGSILKLVVVLNKKHEKLCKEVFRYLTQHDYLQRNNQIANNI